MARRSSADLVVGTAAIPIILMIAAIVLSAIILPGIGYLIFLFITPLKFTIYKKYKIHIEEIKKLKKMSIILYVISLIVIYAILAIVNPKQVDPLFYLEGISAVISLVFLKFAIQTTKKEREEIKQIKKFNVILKEIIDAKKPIIQQAISLHTRSSDKYNEILRLEFDDVVEKVQSQLNVSLIIMDAIKDDIMKELKSI